MTFPALSDSLKILQVLQNFTNKSKYTQESFLIFNKLGVIDNFDAR